jgi:hypothetical protein
MLWSGVCPLQTIGHLKNCRGTYFETPHPFFSIFPWYPVWKIKSFSSLHKIMPLERGVDEGHIFQEHPIPRPLLCVKNQNIFEISAPIWASLIWGTPPLAGHYTTHYLCACPAILGGKLGSTLAQFEVGKTFSDFSSVCWERLAGCTISLGLVLLLWEFCFPKAQCRFSLL